MSWVLLRKNQFFHFSSKTLMHQLLFNIHKRVSKLYTCIHDKPALLYFYTTLRSDKRKVRFSLEIRAHTTLPRHRSLSLSRPVSGAMLRPDSGPKRLAYRRSATRRTSGALRLSGFERPLYLATDDRMITWTQSKRDITISALPGEGTEVRLRPWLVSFSQTLL